MNADAVSTNLHADDLPGNLELQFDNPEHFSQVQLVHDTVMGGRSEGLITPVTEPAGLRFAGHLSLANNGGFASAEFKLAKTLPAQAFNQLRLNALTDGRTYQLRLKTPDLPRGVAYVADFDSVIEQQYYYFKPDAFTGRYRGRQVANLPELNLADVSHISLMLADKNSGPFSIVLYSVMFKVPVP